MIRAYRDQIRSDRIRAHRDQIGSDRIRAHRYRSGGALAAQVGANDLHDGLTTSVELYYADALAPPAAANALQIAVLPVLILGNLLFLQHFFRPWRAPALSAGGLRMQIGRFGRFWTFKRSFLFQHGGRK